MAGRNARPLFCLGSLSFDVLLDPLKRSPASAGGEIGRRPKDALPVTSGEVAPRRSKQARRRSFERVDQNRDGIFRRIFDQQVNVIALAVAGDKHAIHRLADLGEVCLEPFNRRVVENLPPVFRDENQMADQFRDGVASSTIF